MAKITESKVKVVDQIISRLEEAERDGLDIPWRQTWKGSMFSIQNAKTGKGFAGGNWINFYFTSMFMGYSSSLWATANQWKKLGTNPTTKTITLKGGKEKEVEVSDAYVRKGEKATYGLVPLPGKKTIINDEGEEEEHKFVYFKAFPYFNQEQMVGIDETKLPNRQLDTFVPIEQIENILNKVQGIDLRHGNGSAYYDNKNDYVMMPVRESFESEEFYYAVRIHETAHWTGHADRFDRHGVDQTKPFGSEDYSVEELIAEFTTAMLCAQVGIGNVTIENSAAYIQNWLKKIKEDKNIILTAASEAQKVVDYILSFGEEEGQGSKQ